MSIDIPTAPAEFEAYWTATMAELADLPLAAELTPCALHSTDFATLYTLRLTSVGPYRIFAYYTVPKGSGPFPVVYHTPGYGSVLHIAPYEERQRYVTVALRHRGMRHADQPYAAAYPGLLTDGIESPASYVYRGIVADCCRVIDFLLSRSEVDTDRIAVVGNDLALVTAALRPRIDALYWSPALFYAACQLAPRTSAYPLEEFNDFMRAYPAQMERMAVTLGYFDPLYFVPKVRAATVMMTGSAADLYSPEATAPLAAAFRAPLTQYESAHSSYKDGVHQATWLAQRYGYDEPLLPPHWRSRS